MANHISKLDDNDMVQALKNDGIDIYEHESKNFYMANYERLHTIEKNHSEETTQISCKVKY